MKVLIIGAKGMLGQELVHTFSDMQVIAWDRDTIDITQKDDVWKKIKEVQPNILINAAAYNAVDKAEKEWKRANMVNGYAVGYLAQITAQLDIPIVHYSSDYVFYGDKKEGYIETDQPNPQGKYAQSKYLGEKELQNNTSKYYIIRLSRLFGKPAQSKDAKKSFVDIILELARNKDVIKAIDEEVSSPTYSSDLAALTKRIILDNYPFGVYHGANEGSCTWYGFAKEIFVIKGIDKEIVPVGVGEFPRKAPRPSFSILLNTKLPKQRQWEQALKEYLEK